MRSSEDEESRACEGDLRLKTVGTEFREDRALLNSLDPRLCADVMGFMGESVLEFVGD